LFLKRKTYSTKLFKRNKDYFSTEYDIHPQSWIMPYDYNEIIKDKEKEENENEFYIQKPVDESCGKGIHVLHK
jgi:hypothetical protein